MTANINFPEEVFRGLKKLVTMKKYECYNVA